MPKRTDIFARTPSPSKERAISHQENVAAYHVENALRVLQHVVVPEADYAVAERFDDFGTRSVDFRRVLTSVQLDCETEVTTSEICNEAADGKLADELGTFEAAAAQVVPETVFGISAVAPQFACDRRHSLFRQWRAPSSQPSPRGGEGVRSATRRRKQVFQRAEPLTLSPAGRGQGEGAHSLRNFTVNA
jgi:hypothetical protein